MSQSPRKGISGSRVSESKSSRKLSDQARLPTPQYRMPTATVILVESVCRTREILRNCGYVLRAVFPTEVLGTGIYSSVIFGGPMGLANAVEDDPLSWYPGELVFLICNKRCEHMVLERALRRVGFGPPRVNQMVALSLFAVALLTSLASSVFKLYEKFWWLDEALHSYFTFSLTLVLALYTYGKMLTGRYQHRVLLVLSIAGLGLACGSLWEIAEWGYDQTVSSEAIYGTTLPITDMTDTMTDLIMNLAGSLAAGITSLRMLVNEVDICEEEP